MTLYEEARQLLDEIQQFDERYCQSLGMTLAEMYGLDWVGADRGADNNPKYPFHATMRMSEYVSDVECDFEDCDEFAVYGFDWMQ